MEILEAKGFGGVPVPNTFVRQAAGADTLGILLPGVGYTCEMPLLYYSRHLLESRGCDVLAVEYDYRQLPEGTSLDGMLDRLTEDSTAVIAAGLAQRDYRSTLLIGKSLGTIAMAHFRDLFGERDVRWCWLTPLLKRDDVLEQIKARGRDSLVVIGTADSHYDAGILAGLETNFGVTNVIVRDANHGIDIPGDIRRSLDGIRQVIAGLEQFLDSGAGKGDLA
jgi:hypothetical protein